MVRTADPRRPLQLLDRIGEHLLVSGSAEVALRPLARAVGSSPRVLLYYFGSKEQLLGRVLARLREQQRESFDRLRTMTFETPSGACRAIWRQMRAAQSEPVFRLFFDAYALALRNPSRFADFLASAVEDWMEFIAAPLCASGWARNDARALATVIVAGFRGLMLDYCASHDRRRVDHAADLWIQSLDTIPLTRGRRGARRDKQGAAHEGAA
jgi:AcrR family transcriptional regulator